MFNDDGLGQAMEAASNRDSREKTDRLEKRVKDLEAQMREIAAALNLSQRLGFKPKD